MRYAAHLDLVNDRAKDIAEEQKPRVLILGLSPSARKEGGTGQVFALDTIESSFIEEIVHARNSFQDPGYFKTLNTEQLLALDLVSLLRIALLACPPGQGKAGIGLSPEEDCPKARHLLPAAALASPMKRERSESVCPLSDSIDTTMRFFSLAISARV